MVEKLYLSLSPFVIADASTHRSNSVSTRLQVGYSFKKEDRCLRHWFIQPGPRRIRILGYKCQVIIYL
jgi:hypothetical protein